MYTFTKLHVTVHEYGSKTTFSDNNEEWTKAVNSAFLRLTGKLKCKSIQDLS